MHHLPDALAQMTVTPDTSGWDTLYAIRFDDLNAAIRSQAVSPTAFLARDDADARVKLEGRFALAGSGPGEHEPWQVTAGGSGQLIKIEMKIKDMDLTRPVEPGDPSDERTYTTSYEVATATASLRLSAVATGETTRGAAVHEIRVPRNAPSGGATVEAVEIDVDEPDTLTRTLIRSLFAKYLEENVGQFDMVFASVDVGAKASDRDGEGSFGWLDPTAIGYAVADQGTVQTGIFAVLAMTEGRTPPRTRAVSPDAIPAGSPSGFLVSQDRFLQKLLLPGVTRDFFRDEARTTASGEDDFEFTKGDVLVNDKRLYLDPLFVEDGVEVRPHVERGNIQYSVERGRLVMRLKGFTYAWPKGLIKGATIKSDVTQEHSLSLGQSEAFLLTEESTVLERGTIEHTKGLVAAQIITPIVTAMVLAAIGYGIGRAVSGTAQVATSANGATVGAVEGASQGTGLVTAAAAREAGELAGAAGPAANFFSRTGVKAAAGVTAILVEATAAAILPIMADAQSGDAEEAVRLSMKPFMTQALGSVRWPLGGEAAAFGIRSLTLNGAMQAGIVPNQ